MDGLKTGIRRSDRSAGREREPSSVLETALAGKSLARNLQATIGREINASTVVVPQDHVACRRRTVAPQKRSRNTTVDHEQRSKFLITSEDRMMHEVVMIDVHQVWLASRESCMTIPASATCAPALLAFSANDFH